MSNIDPSIGKIEGDLKKLWAEQKEKNQTRASLFNLLIYTHDPARAAYMRNSILSIVEKFPCRILLIENNPDPKKDYLRGSVTSALTGSGAQTVSCDQINIEVTDGQVSTLPFVILPHLVPDLPLYVIWEEDPVRTNPLLTTLQKYASRILFDSETATDLRAFSQKVLRFEKESPCEIMDTQWAILSPWRTVLAEVFNTEARIAFLREAQSLRITYHQPDSKAAAPLARPLLFQAWLAARLGWQYKQQKNKTQITYASNGKEIIVELIGSLGSKEVPPGSILAFEHATADGHTTAISRLVDPSKVVVHIASKEACDLPFNLSLANVYKSTNFLKEMFYRQCGEHYRSALKILQELE